jgi:flavorubredoxin
MGTHRLSDTVQQLAIPDWNRRVFDALVPIPDGTSYNAYLVTGSEKTVLVDTADPSMAAEFERLLASVPRVDHVISLHAEQDHSGLIPRVLARYPGATVLTSPKAKPMLADLLAVPAERVVTVADGEQLSLGHRTIRFVHTPWVHWPETMCALLVEERLLFSCDFFGSHLASSGAVLDDPTRVAEAAKRYFATIMMPFAKFIDRHLKTVAELDVATIAPSHGPIHRDPKSIIAAHRQWVSGPLADRVVIAYESMHHSTKHMVQLLGDALVRQGVAVELFQLGSTDLGRLAMAMVDAATIVLGTPTVAGGPHPSVLHAAYVASILRPRAKHLGVVGSAGWSAAKTVKMLAELLSSLPAEVLEPVFATGMPKEADCAALEALASTIVAKHGALGIHATA